MRDVGNMEAAIIIKKVALGYRPQFILIIHSCNGYTVYIIDKVVQAVEGQILYKVGRGLWQLSGSRDIFPANILGNMSLLEANDRLSSILSMND